MSKRITRRRLITTGLAGVAGASGLAAAARLADRYGLIPPDHQGLFGAGETLTYAAQRILTARHSLAREFDRSRISSVAPVNGDPPVSNAYMSLMVQNFVTWRLRVDGLVARPATFTLPELKALPVSRQITQQACEEGWSFIAEWAGVKLSEVLNLVGVSARARYVVFLPFDRSWDSLDMADAWHPQTLLGGQQSARTIHFVVALVLVLFLAGHVLMVFLAGFTSTMRAMILGRPRATGPWGPASAGP